MLHGPMCQKLLRIHFPALTIDDGQQSRVKEVEQDYAPGTYMLFIGPFRLTVCGLLDFSRGRVLVAHILWIAIGRKPGPSSRNAGRCQSHDPVDCMLESG